MSGRYEYNKTKKTQDGRTVYASKIYPNIPLSDSDIYVATELGDRLDTLAYYFYKDSTLWWIIASANKLHNGKFALADGTVLRIPANYINIINNFIN